MDGPTDNSKSRKNHLVQFYDAELNLSDLLSEERYIDHELIDEGAIKTVYRVTDTHCAREVAYARIKDGVFSPEHAIDFVREVQTTSGFEHPNIIRIYGVGIEAGIPWFTMELSSGRNLTELILEGKKISLADRLEMFVQLCDAVSYAHERDVIHLDLKPDNIAIGKRGQVLLADWGLASSICLLPEADLVKGQTQIGMIKGSLGYMAPEQSVSGYIKTTTADIFGLGAILYFLLTKEAPIPGKGSDEVLANTQAGVIKTLNRPEIPQRLVPLLAKVLSKDPSGRYASAAELKSEIEAFRNGFATLAETASVWAKLGLFCRRNKALSLTVLVACVALIASTLYYIYSIKQSEALANEARIDAEQQQEKAEKHRIEAEAQREIAEQALAKFLEAEELTQRTNREFAANLFGNADDYMRAFDFEKALLSSKKAVERDPTNQEALRRLGVVHFVRQEFVDAAHYLNASEWDSVGVRNLTQIAEAQRGKAHPLAVADLTEVLGEVVDSLYFLKVYMLKHDAKLRAPRYHSQVVAYMLKETANLETLQFKYTVKRKTLDLSGNPALKNVMSDATTFFKPLNLLSTLPIQRLILDDTEYNRANVAHFRPHLQCEVVFK